MTTDGLFGRGSSPRMRGAPFPGEVANPGAGIIPADAGSTRVQRYRSRVRRDHPRGCGEHPSLFFEA